MLHWSTLKPPPSSSNSCTEESQRNLIRIALVEEIWPKNIKNTIVGNIESGEPYVSKEGIRLLKKRPIVFSDQNQNKYTGPLLFCLGQYTHFQVPEHKFMEECLSCMEAGPMHSAVELAKRFVCFCTNSSSLNGYRLARSNRAKKLRSAMLTMYKMHYTDVIVP